MSRYFKKKKQEKRYASLKLNFKKVKKCAVYKFSVNLFISIIHNVKECYLFKIVFIIIALIPYIAYAFECKNPRNT